MHDHPAIVLQAIRALKPHGLVRRIRVCGRSVELYLEDGRVLRREIPAAEAAAAEAAGSGMDAPLPAGKASRRPSRKLKPKD